MTLTDQQLEAAAMALCDLCGWNPKEVVVDYSTYFDLGSDVYPTVSLLEIAKRKVRQHHVLSFACSSGQSAVPPTDFDNPPKARPDTRAHEPQVINVLTPRRGSWAEVGIFLASSFLTAAAVAGLIIYSIAGNTP